MFFFSALADWFSFLLFWMSFISILTYLIPILLCTFLWKEPQDLKKKYNAEWGLVTGASSGIGKAIAEKLASQDINVVLVALDNDLLPATTKELREKYPSREFVSVGVNLGREGYMEPVIEATKDLPISLLFNNAGYITTGLFSTVDIERLMTNFHCNSACQVRLTHHFVKQMVSKGLKGAVLFTSSPAGLMPSPISVLYGSTKAFVTEFAASLAPELKDDNIDVLVVHPSPVATNFYNTAHKIGSLLFFKKTATGPSHIADAMFRGIGRTVIYDQGYFPIGLKFLLKLVDFNFLTLLFTYTARFSGDFKIAKKKQ